MNAQLMSTYERKGYVNRPLTAEEVINKVKYHSINYFYRKGRLYVIESFSNAPDEIHDTTGWMLFDLLAFLNY